MHPFPKSALAILIFASILVATACGSSSAQIRLLNAFPSQSSLDMLIDSKSTATAVAYAAASGYSSVSPGSRHLQIEATGTSTVLADQTISLGSGTSSTVLATNSGTTVLTDSNTTPASGNFTIRVINASSTLGTADIYIVSSGTDISTVSPNYSSVAFASATGYSSLTPGSYQVIFTLPGQKFASISSSPTSFSSGQVRTVAGLDGQNGGFTMAVIADKN